MPLTDLLRKNSSILKLELEGKIHTSINYVSNKYVKFNCRTKKNRKYMFVSSISIILNCKYKHAFLPKPENKNSEALTIHNKHSFH